MPTLKVAIDARGARTGARAFSGAARRVGSSATRAAKMIIGLGGAISAAFIVRDMIKTMVAYEKTMAVVRGVTKATAEEFKALSATARELGAATRYTAAEAAAGMVELARMGFTVNETIGAIPATLLLATGGMLELKDAAMLTATTLNQFQLNSRDAERVTDVLISTANRAGTDVRLLGEALSYAGTLAGELGMSLEETSAALGVLADRGIKGSRAGTSLRMVLVQLAKADDKVLKTLEKLGIAYDEVNPEKRNLIEIFKRFQQSTISAADATKLFGVRSLAAGLILAKNADSLEELTKMNEKARGEAKRMSDIMEDTLAGAFKRLKSAIEEVYLSVGDKGLSGGIRFLVENLKELIRWLNGASTTSKGFVRDFRIGLLDLQIGASLVWAEIEHDAGIMFATLTWGWDSVINGVKSAMRLVLDIMMKGMHSIIVRYREMADIIRKYRGELEIVLGKTTVGHIIGGLNSLDNAMLGVAESMLNLHKGLEVNATATEVFDKEISRLNEDLQDTKEYVTGLMEADLRKIRGPRPPRAVITPVALTEEDLLSVLQALETEATGAGNALSYTKDEAERLVRQAEELGDAFGNAMETLIMGGKSAMDVMRDLGMEITSAILRAAVIEPIVSGITGAFTPAAAVEAVAGAVSAPTAQAPAPTRVTINVQTPDADSFRQSQSQISSEISRSLSK